MSFRTVVAAFIGATLAFSAAPDADFDARDVFSSAEARQTVGGLLSPPSPVADGLVRTDQMDGGALLFFTDEPGLYVPAPLLSTSVDVSVSGPLARTVVTQRFRNVADVFVEGKYLFPLPEGAAVDTLKMRIGDRLIEGEIKEREEAREIYETAKAEGYKASLVEQERPNVFTSSVANIGPNEVVVVQIEYQETLRIADGVFGLRIPLVVAPRYAPEPQPQLVVFGPDGWTEKRLPAPLASAIGAGRAGAGRITAPVADPRADAPGEIRNPATISISLDAGFPLGDVESLFHEVSIARGDDETTAEVALTGPVPSDRDFYLSWAPETIDAPYLQLYSESLAEDAATENDPTGEHFVFMITPPAVETLDQDRKPRDVVFVQDVSGSMFGESIEQARAGLALAIERLRPEDRFNLIVFSDRYAVYAEELVQATPENVALAVRSVQGLEADGGTEMLPALEQALKDPTPEDDTRLRQVVFLTDGAVSNEIEMLRLIERDLGRSRLFTVGIGSAPNSYFMTAAAEAGRGAHVFIGDLADVQERMEALFRRIETPAMTDLAITVDGLTDAELQAVEYWPNPLPDLYAGDPVVATIRLPEGADASAVKIEGVRGRERWSAAVPFSDAEARDGVSKLWARERIRSLEAFRLSPEVDAPVVERIDAEILETALAHELVSRLTSLVAVDVTPTRPVDEAAVDTEVLLALPKGWDPAKFFDDGETEPAPAPAGLRDAAAPSIAPAAFELSDAAEARLVQAAAVRSAAVAAGAPIPATAANWSPVAVLGLLMMAAGIFLIRLSARRAKAAAIAIRVEPDRRVERD